jgi:DNA-binding NtrC family response regulator
MQHSPGDRDFRFVLRVLDEDGGAGANFFLAPGKAVVGVGPDCVVRLEGRGISRRHACLEVLPDGGVLLEDLGSRNGTWLGRKRVHRVALTGGEMVAFASRRTTLIPLDPGEGRLAFPVTPARLAVPTALDPSHGSTAGLSVRERFLRSLAVLVQGMDFGSRLAALSQRWLTDFLVDRVEILRGSHLLAAAGSETEAPPDAVLEGAGAQVRWWGPEAPRILALGSTLELLTAFLEPPIQVGAAAASALEATSGAKSGPGGGLGRGATALPEPGTLSPQVRQLYHRAAKIAAGEIPILILGESGTGKDVLARWIHSRSRRRQGSFLVLNCAALPRELLEAELFGIERGVATGVEARPGLLERADGGTLFLDEIGDMAPDTQAKVLRALEDRQIYRVGGRCPVPVDVRFLAATNRNLEERIDSGEFRRDLFHRLAAHEARLPSLRQRPEDIALLAGHFFQRELARQGIPSPGMTRNALAALTAYDWPGNIRELINEMAKAVLLLEPGQPLDLSHLSARVKGALDGRQEAPLSLAAQMLTAERAAYAAALAASDGDAGSALDLLGVSKATFYRKIKELGLRRDEAEP